MFGLLWEFYQSRKMRDVQTEARERGYEARQRRLDTKIEVKDVQRKIDKLELINLSIWTMLKEKLDLTEEDLLQKVQEIDLMDGAEDEKITKVKVRSCPNCKRKSNTRHLKCLYCGYDFEDDSAFDTI